MWRNTSALLGQHRSPGKALCSSSAIQERGGLAEGNAEKQKDGQSCRKQIQEKVEGCIRDRIQPKEHKAKERHDKEEGIFFPHSLSIGQGIAGSKAEQSYRGGKIFSMTKIAKGSNDILGRLWTLHTGGTCWTRVLGNILGKHTFGIVVHPALKNFLKFFLCSLPLILVRAKFLRHFSIAHRPR